MKIVIAGCGKVGTAVARQLSAEGHDITVIDRDPERVRRVTESLDVMGIVGNGSSVETFNEVGIEDVGVFIAVTGTDEVNLLSCMFAKRASHCRAIARVRNPVYNRELDFIRKQMGISTIINPEFDAATEISRLLRFPAASKIDSFAEDRVRLIKFEMKADYDIAGISLREFPSKVDPNILICAIERGKNVMIPDGNTTLQKGDIITFLATNANAAAFLKKLKVSVKPVKSAIIVGGGTIGYYLAYDLLQHGVSVKLLEKDEKKCNELIEQLPGAVIINADGTDREVLLAEGLEQAEAVAALTNVDEENVFLTLFAKKHSRAKLVTKVNRLEFDDILSSMELGSIVYPKYLICDQIMQNVRAMQNAAGNNIKTLYRILDDRVEALEFTVNEESAATKAPISGLKLKKNLLICCITRGNEVIIPRGSDQIRVGDTVVVVALEQGLHDIRDILAH